MQQRESELESSGLRADEPTAPTSASRERFEGGGRTLWATGLARSIRAPGPGSPTPCWVPPSSPDVSPPVSLTSEARRVRRGGSHYGLRRSDSETLLDVRRCREEERDVWRTISLPTISDQLALSSETRSSLTPWRDGAGLCSRRLRENDFVRDRDARKRFCARGGPLKSPC